MSMTSVLLRVAGRHIQATAAAVAAAAAVSAETDKLRH